MNGLHVTSFPLSVCIALLSLLVLSTVKAEPPTVTRTLRVRLTVEPPLSHANTPLDPAIDFPELIRQSGAPGVLDPNSIEVRNATTNEPVSHALTEDFAYSDKGRVEFIVADQRHTEFEIRFTSVGERPPLQPQSFTPQIGVGDLTRLRYITGTAEERQFFSHTYMAVDFADFNRDGKLDLVTTRNGTNAAEFYLNTGKRDVGGMPTFESAGSVNVARWQSCRAVDLNGDGAIDLVVDGEYLRNENPTGWPFRAAKPVTLDGGRQPCFLDMDRDGQLDSICLHGGMSVQHEQERPFLWRTGAALADFNGDGLTDLVTHDGHTRVATLFAQYRAEDTTLRLRKDHVLTLSDGQPINDAIIGRRAHWTESFRAVDWDADGLQDLIYSVAGAHNGTKDGGSIYLLHNVGTNTAPVFAAPTTMCCFGAPIRISSHGPHPWPGDFDGDGKPDLLACVEWSVYPYYSHAALMMRQRPAYKLELLK